MKEVMLSIKPQWCELIARGKKTVEVRKTKPKIDTPFKCYIYCTNDFRNCETRTRNNEFWIGEPINSISKGRYIGNGKIIGEFVCDKIIYLGNVATDLWDGLSGSVHDHHKSMVRNQALLTEKEMLSYGGRHGWHISDLKIYDKPKELSEFRLKRPFQSWGYINENDT